ncbi:MAG: hypothetical protein EOM67_10320 [Spirochaetia bacterium]|nr:hypothetical protein [Spirochaetia bacterium]
MIKIQVRPFPLKLRNPFTLAHGSSSVRENVFIEITMNGCTGYGEGPIVPYYHNTKEQVIDDITETLKGYKEGEIVEMIEKGVTPLFKFSTSRAAFDSAAVNIRSCSMKKSPSEILEVEKTHNFIPSTFTIAYHDDIDKMVSIATSCGFQRLKIKAGLPGDITRIKAIREALPDAQLFVDANQGWSVNEAHMNLKELEGYNITLVEEPIKGSPEEIEEVAKNTSIPIFLDESIQRMEEVKLYRTKAPHLKGIVIKSAKIGGPYETKKIIGEARKHNFLIFLSSMVESSVGIASVVPFIPMCDYIDLDGPLLITNDPFSGLSYEHEQLILSSGGLKPNQEIVKLFSITLGGEEYGYSNRRNEGE